MATIEQKRAAAIARHAARMAIVEEQATRDAKAATLRRAGKFQMLLVAADMPLVRLGGNSLHELREDVFDAASNMVRFGQYDAAMMGGEPFAIWN